MAGPAGLDDRSSRVSADQYTSAPATRRASGVAIGGFVTGLLGALLSWFPIAGIVLGILGVVLGGIGISQGRRTGAPTGLATAGVVLGALAIVIAVVLVAVVAANV